VPFALPSSAVVSEAVPPLAVDLAVGKEPPQVARGEQVRLLPRALLAPAEGEAGVEPALEPLGEELEERELVVGLDREPAVRRLHVVALGHAPDLTRERELELLGDVLDHRAREGERKLLVVVGEPRRVRDLNGDVVLPEPFALQRVEVDGDDLVRRVEALERPAGARPDVEDALTRADPAELEEPLVAVLAPAADAVARMRPPARAGIDEPGHGLFLAWNSPAGALAPED
jgi:hypothetical protein